MDVCFLLTPQQIKKLLSIYHQSQDFDEHPVSPEIIKVATSKCVDNESSSASAFNGGGVSGKGGADGLLLDTSDDSPFIIPTPMTSLDDFDRFIPPFMLSKLVILKHVIEIGC